MKKHAVRRAQTRGRKRQERRSELGRATRAIIRTSLGMSEEQLAMKLQAGPVAARVLDPVELTHVTLDLPLDEPGVSLRQPRPWVKETLRLIEVLNGVKIETVLGSNGGADTLRISGTWSDTHLAEIAVRRMLFSANRLADLVYRKTFDAAKAKGKVEKARGSRRAFLEGFVGYAQEDVARLLGRLRDEFGVEAVEKVLNPVLVAEPVNLEVAVGS